MSNLQSSIPKVPSSGGAKEASIYKKIFKPYGWLKTLYELAESQVFTKPDKNPIDSVLHTTTGEVFTYLSFIAARSIYDNEISELRRKK